jgi:mRNA interferase HigB
MEVERAVQLDGRAVLEAFKQAHADARAPLERWEGVVVEARWRTFGDLRRTLPSADQVRLGRELIATVFNVGGNKYRLVSEVDYLDAMVRALMILTHADYDKGRWKGTLAR